jgi:PAS domain S-box-containing protein
MLELAQSERRFRMIAEATRDMVTETDASGRFTYVSPACTAVLGYSAEELLSRSPLHLHHEEDREAFRQEVLASREPGKPFTVRPHRLRCKDGSWVWVEANGVRYQSPDGELRLVGVARDITSRLRQEEIRQQLEEQLRSSQKLESLGILAGGIAHDFNNYLTPIVGMAGLLGADLPADSPLLPRVELIQKAARRATDLTAQMLAFAGGTEPRLAPLDLSETVHGMRLLLESTATHRAELVYDLASELPRVKADDGQIGQVIMNLVSNGAEALGDAGGRIEIRTGQLEADRDFLRDYHFGEQRGPGTYVYVEVCDDGEGIDEETRKHIFDPFFSTKFTGRGLGLAVVLGIVKGHRGALRIESSPEAGTRFRILLPATSAAENASTDDRSDAHSDEARWTRPGTILVIDDDEGALEVTSILLERAGFEVLSERDGAQAIETFREHSAEITGIVLDNTMPSHSGTQVFDAIREIASEIPIVLALGYSRERVSNELLARGETRFLHKPFSADQLYRTLRQLLGPTNSTPGGSGRPAGS